MSICKDKNEFWKKIGTIGVGNERNKSIPMEVVCEDGSTSTDPSVVLEKWKTSFETLFNAGVTETNVTDMIQNGTECETLNTGITVGDVIIAVHSLNMNKAMGCDNIPAEVLKTDRCIAFLHRLFCICFDTGKIPKIWEHGVISPLLKDSTTDPRDPLNYRGITVTSSVYKAYCSVLNTRLTEWAENSGKITDYQNGFRQKRSTIDQLTSLTSIIENRKKDKKSTYTAMVDFSKAYDKIDRHHLWEKVSSTGIRGNMLRALRAIYSNVECSVKVNGHLTDSFKVLSGLKQGCLLSTTLFNLYINDLSDLLCQSKLGIDIDGIRINHLLYADDLVLIASNEGDLQLLLNILAEWCDKNKMKININKTKIIHFRNKSVERSKQIFSCGNDVIDFAGQYRYLGLVLSEHLDYAVTAKYVAQAATRSLGLLISKFKHMGGMPYNVYTTLYDSMVWSVISYGAAIWGTREYSAINAVQHRAIRFFLGVGRYTPNAAINGDMGWTPPYIRQWKSVMGHWFRLTQMNNRRINRHIFKWCENKMFNSKNWCYDIHKHILKQDMCSISSDALYSGSFKHTFISEMEGRMMNQYVNMWTQGIQSVTSNTRGNRGSKLKIYRKFKIIYETERYLILPTMSRSRRSALAKFRCGVAPLRIETGRYEGLRIDQRLCFNCKTTIESEQHVLLECPLYNDIREELYNNVTKVYTNFHLLDDIEKLCLLMSCVKLIQFTAKACNNILVQRRRYLYQ